MWIGWAEFDILLGDVHSLKEKRSIVRPLVVDSPKQQAIYKGTADDLDEK